MIYYTKIQLNNRETLGPKGQMSHEFGPTLRDESNGIGLVVLSGQ